MDARSIVFIEPLWVSRVFIFANTIPPFAYDSKNKKRQHITAVMYREEPEGSPASESVLQLPEIQCIPETVNIRYLVHHIHKKRHVVRISSI